MSIRRTTYLCLFLLLSQTALLAHAASHDEPLAQHHCAICVSAQALDGADLLPLVSVEPTPAHLAPLPVRALPTCSQRVTQPPIRGPPLLLI